VSRSAPPVGRLRLLWHLLKIAREAHPGVSPRAFWRVLKLFGRKLRWLGPLRSWHSDTSNPALREMLGHRPSLVLAVGRPYINDRWPVPRRLDAIWEHYSLLRGPLGFLRFDPGAQLLLATVETEVTLVPCRANYETQVPTKVTVQFLVFNEFENRFSTSLQFECWSSFVLSDIANVFNVLVTNTRFAQTQMRPSDVSSGLVGVVEEYHTVEGATSRVAFNLHEQGERATTDLIFIPEGP